MYDPKTKQVYTPNTNRTARMGEERIAEDEKEPETELPIDNEDDMIEMRGRYIQGPDGKMNGSMPDPGGSSKKGLTKDGGNGKVKSSQKVSATGANKFKKGFSEKNLAKHWEGKPRNHSKEYPGWTKEQYAQRALELIQKPVGGNIDGYKTAKGQIIRYDRSTNDYVAGMPGKGIATMFKPSSGSKYFKRLKKRDGVSDE